MAKKKKKRKRNTCKNQNINPQKSGQVVTQEHKVSDSSQPHETNDVKKTYMGLKPKTWSIIFLLVILASFIIFLIIPYTIGLTLAAQNNSVDDFLNKTNGFTIFLSVIGTAASIFSIIITFLDKQRFSAEKEQSVKFFSKVADLSKTLLNVSENVKTIKEDNEKLSLEVHDLKNEVSISKQIIEANLRAWNDKRESKEKED